MYPTRPARPPRTARSVSYLVAFSAVKVKVKVKPLAVAVELLASLDSSEVVAPRLKAHRRAVLQLLRVRELPVVYQHAGMTEALT